MHESLSMSKIIGPESRATRADHSRVSYKPSEKEPTTLTIQAFFSTKQRTELHLTFATLLFALKRHDSQANVKSRHIE